MLQWLQRIPGQIWGFLLPAGNCLLPAEPGLMHNPGSFAPRQSLCSGLCSSGDAGGDTPASGGPGGLCLCWFPAHTAGSQLEGSCHPGSLAHPLPLSLRARDQSLPAWRWALGHPVPLFTAGARRSPSPGSPAPVDAPAWGLHALALASH